MRKRRIQLLILVALVFLLAFWKRHAWQPVDFVNKNCDTPYKLTMPESELTGTEELMGGGGFGCYTLSDEAVCYTIAGYPDVLDANHVKAIELLSDKYHILGLTIGDDFSKAKWHLRSQGFRRTELDVLSSEVIMVLNGVRIKITPQDDMVGSIHIWVNSTNRKNVVF